MACKQGVPFWAWKGNRVADQMVKDAAGEFPHSKVLCDKFLQQQGDIKHVCKFLAAMLERVCAPLRNVAKTSKIVPNTGGLVLVPEPNGHQICRFGKGFSCARCPDTGRTYSRLASCRCVGWPHAARQAHPSHKLRGGRWDSAPSYHLVLSVWGVCPSSYAFAFQSMSSEGQER